MTNQVIPDEAVEAACGTILPYVDDEHFDLRLVARLALEAAAPHIATRQEAALEAVCKALSDAEAFGRLATHAEIMAAMRAGLTP